MAVGQKAIDTKHKIILFLEDEAELLATISQLLSDQGYSVVNATSAEDALQLMESTTPDLILADIKLPGIDGFEFFQKVYRVERWKRIPFVFLTAFNDLKARMYAKRHGAVEYITKPFDFEYLIHRIHEILPPNS